jgi:hypothetical protein
VVTPEVQLEPGPLVTEVRERSPVGQYEEAACRRREHSVDNPTRWFHPRDNFYPPGGAAPTRPDLDHLASEDFAVVVTYAPDAPRAAREALERWAVQGIGVIVAPNAAQDPPPLEAYTFDRRLTCDGVDLDRLTTFTDRHFSRPLDYEPHGQESSGGDGSE